MDGLALATARPTAAGSSFSFTGTTARLPSSLLATWRSSRRRNVGFHRKPKFVVFASKDEPSKSKLDQWDQMELKFGQLLGEDPKLTLAKIMGKKLNPEASYLEIEKSFYKKKGKLEVGELPFDGSKEKQSSSSVEGLNLVRPVPKKEISSIDGLNLVRPVPKKGIKFQNDDKPIVSTVRKPSQSVRNAVENNTKGRVPDVILRKPTMYIEDDVEEKPSRLRMKPNLSLKMRDEQTTGRFSDMTLLRKPEPVIVNENTEVNEPSGNTEAKVLSEIELRKSEGAKQSVSDFILIKRPEAMSVKANLDTKQDQSGISEKKAMDFIEDNGSESSEITNSKMEKIEESLGTTGGSANKESEIEIDPVIASRAESYVEEAAASGLDDTSIIDSKVPMEAAKKPERLDPSIKGASNLTRTEPVLVNPESNGNDVEPDNVIETSPLSENEIIDWTRAEGLVKAGGKEEVELISSSTRGFVVSFGSLVGFLPYRNLAARWKFLAFESWLKQKGVDPSVYKQNLGITGSYYVTNSNISPDSSIVPEVDVNGGIAPDMKLEDLLRIYDHEKIKFLSSFVGQKIKVNVVLADRKSRKLIFSLRPKEKDELVEKKRNLMAKLRIGDVVKCCVKKITYFGIFTEVEGVPALIHQTEVSWDATLDPASYFKIGQIVEAKVYQLDFALERIFLSLKEITPDPLNEALDSVVGDRDSLDGTLVAAEADTEWADVEILIKELHQIEGVQSVSKGRFFLSPGLTPTFQVYMASMFENQYKLLARSGNKVQEVIVEASLSKEMMKEAIETCTNRVE